MSKEIDAGFIGSMEGVLFLLGYKDGESVKGG
jgi:hypothetical protein